MQQPIIQATTNKLSQQKLTGTDKLLLLLNPVALAFLRTKNTSKMTVK